MIDDWVSKGMSESLAWSRKVMGHHIQLLERVLVFLQDVRLGLLDGIGKDIEFFQQQEQCQFLDQLRLVYYKISDSVK
jgi:hypothetical protein